MSIPHIGWLAILAVLLLVLAWLALSLRRAKRSLHELQHKLQVEREVDEINRNRAAAEGFYDNVLEADITNNRLLGQNSANLRAQLQLPNSASFSDCIEGILQLFIKEPYRDLYRAQFDRNSLLARFDAGDYKFTFEFEERADLKNYCWTRVTVCLYYSETSQAVKIISYVKNIQKEKEKELHLLKEANTDYLTGLYNKRAAEPMIGSILDASREGAHCHALLIIDVDDFKRVNDSVGHAGGDGILRMVGELLLQQSRPQDVVSRIGGDEFLLFLQDCGEAKTALEVANRLTQMARTLDTTAYKGISISLSIGLALSPQHSEHYADLFNMTDSALYAAKQAGKNTAKLFGANP